MIITKELVINNKKRAVVVAELRAKNFRPFPKVVKVFVATAAEEEAENEIEELDEKGGADSDYDYLLGMALYSLTAEKVSSSTLNLVMKTDESFRSLNYWLNEIRKRRNSMLFSFLLLKIFGLEIWMLSRSNGM